MDILFVTAELSPFSRIGEAADVCAALPKALRGLGHRVTVLSPLYRTVDPVARSLARRLSKIEVGAGDTPFELEVYDGRTAGGVGLLFVGHERLYRGVDSLHGNGHGDADEDAVVRAVVLCRAAQAILATREPRFDVIHAHDGATALAMVLAKREAATARVPAVLTIHDIARQGAMPAESARRLGIDAGADMLADGRVNLLRAGIAAANRITTCSPTYARELLAPDASHGLADALRARGRDVVGILGGVDVSVWNPATDPAIPSRFDPVDLAGKARCKSDLQQRLGLPLRPDVPLFVANGRLDASEGFDLLVDVLPKIARNDLQLVVAGQAADARVVESLREAEQRWPDRVQVRTEVDEGLVHGSVAAADFVIIPARRHACGSGQMTAHRYGALPIARRAGDVADTVVDCDAQLQSGSGFLHQAPTAEELLAAVRRALAAYVQREEIEVLRRRVMRIDHSWERSARLYERLYREATT